MSSDLDYGQRRWTSLRGLERPGHWTADEALAELRRGLGDDSFDQEIVQWIRRDIAPSALSAERLYRQVAETGQGEKAFLSGRRALEAFGYEDCSAHICDWAAERFLGLGNPWRVGRPSPGSRVLDIGCGAGADLQMASAFVGETGRVVGVDMRASLVRRQHRGAPAANVVTCVALASCCPIPDGWADLVVANGLPPLLGLQPEVISEIRRVLTPGGKLLATLLVTARQPLDEPYQDLLLANSIRYGKPLVTQVGVALRRGGFSHVTLHPSPSPFSPGFCGAEVSAVVVEAPR